METLPTTMVNGTMRLGGVILIASIGFEVNRYIIYSNLLYNYNFIINTSKQAATHSPGRLRPRQRGRWLIVMSLLGGIKRNSRNRPHGAKMAAVTYPQNAKNTSIPPS